MSNLRILVSEKDAGVGEFCCQIRGFAMAGPEMSTKDHLLNEDEKKDVTR